MSVTGTNTASYASHVSIQSTDCSCFQEGASFPATCHHRHGTSLFLRATSHGSSPSLRILQWCFQLCRLVWPQIRSKNTMHSSRRLMALRLLLLSPSQPVCF